MAVVKATRTPVPLNGVVIEWAGLANGDTGEPAELNDFADVTAQVTGTFGTGGSVSIEGSNDGTNFMVCTDPQGNAVTETGAALEVLEESPRYLRPDVTGGDGTTNLTVTLYARRQR